TIITGIEEIAAVFNNIFPLMNLGNMPIKVKAKGIYSIAVSNTNNMYDSIFELNISNSSDCVDIQIIINIPVTRGMI
ncbi:MAG: hypothetical protein WC313_06385, partial [Candidatus Kapaibacterium sp.]